MKDIASLKKTVELKDDQIKLLTSTYSDRDDEFETLSAEFKAQNELLDIIKRQLETKDRQIKILTSDLVSLDVESMLPQINKQTKQYIAVNQIKFEEINNEEHNALFPSQSGLGELTRKSSSYRSELCYKVKGFSCGSLEQKFEHLADALWHELRIKGNLQNRKTIKISNTVPSSPRIKKLCLEIFQERFIGTYIKFAVDDSALNQSKLTDLSQDRLSTNPFTVFNGNMRRSTMTEERKERQARFIY